MSIKRRLSQTLGQIRKGFAVDTYEGGFPVADIFGLHGVTASGILMPTAFTDEVQEISSGITQPPDYQCIVVSGMAPPISGMIPTDIPSGVVTIYGSDWAGRRIEESLLIVGGSRERTKYPFKKVDMIKLPPAVGTEVQGVCVGTALVFGLTRPLSTIDTDVYVEIQQDLPSGYVPDLGPLTGATPSLFVLTRLDNAPSGVDLEIDREVNTIGAKAGEEFPAYDDEDDGSETVMRVSYRTEIF